MADVSHGQYNSSLSGRSSAQSSNDGSSASANSSFSLSRSVPLDCYLEDLEHPGVLPPSPFYESQSPIVRKSTSYRDISRRRVEAIRNNSPVNLCLNMPEVTVSELTANSESLSSRARLPGTFDSLHHVQDTGVTPSPRSDTPLVLHPALDTRRSSSSFQQRFRASLGIRQGTVGTGKFSS